MKDLSRACLGVFLWVALLPQPVQASASIETPIVKLRSLDKISARTSIFEARVGSTVQFGQVYIKVQACRKAPEFEQPEAAAFLQIWEIKPEDSLSSSRPEKATTQDKGPEKAAWIFSGWLFASSPGLSSMDHPIYDVWVLDCLGAEKTPEDPVVSPPNPDASQPAP